MLQPLLNVLLSKRIILASSSPRRIQALKHIGFPFESIPSTFEENLNPTDFEKPYEYVIETAKQKALEVARRLQAAKEFPDLIIGADTCVALGKDIFGKPQDRNDAIKTLAKFSGCKHEVYTGIVFLRPNFLTSGGDFDITSFYEVTEVFMTDLTAAMIQSYVDTGEPFDKAGSYGIQDLGGTFVERIRGDYYNVFGFPLHKFCKEIYNMYSQI